MIIARRFVGTLLAAPASRTGFKVGPDSIGIVVPLAP